MAILSIPQPVECLSTVDLVAITECTCTRDELAKYLAHIQDCRWCTGAFDVVATLVINRVWFAEQLGIEATS